MCTSSPPYACFTLVLSRRRAQDLMRLCYDCCSLSDASGDLKISEVSSGKGNVKRAGLTSDDVYILGESNHSNINSVEHTDTERIVSSHVGVVARVLICVFPCLLCMCLDLGISVFVYVGKKTTKNEQHHVSRCRIASHRIASHRIASHRIASHRIPSHPIPSHPIPSHPIMPSPRLSPIQQRIEQ